jgi:hypothetical protein
MSYADGANGPISHQQKHGDKALTGSRNVEPELRLNRRPAAAGNISVREIYAVMLVVSALSGPVMAQDALAPPSGARKLFEFSAAGVQIYLCKPKDQDLAFVFDAPEAVLFDADGKQAGTHFQGPAWKLNDGSLVTGEVSAKQPSPKQGAIPWLLLKVKSHQGAGALDAVNYIRRVDTDGGAEPTEGCDAAHAGETARVPYSATYQFFGQ